MTTISDMHDRFRNLQYRFTLPEGSQFNLCRYGGKYELQILGYDSNFVHTEKKITLRKPSEMTTYIDGMLQALDLLDKQS